MSGEKTSGKGEINQHLINTAKACFDGSLGSAIKVDGKSVPPTDAQKELCATDKMRRAGAEEEIIPTHVSAAKAEFTPKGRGK